MMDSFTILFIFLAPIPPCVISYLLGRYGIKNILKGAKDVIHNE